ncbi:hepatocellular carcinoma-associated antigen 66 [Phaeosphaeriaceae sp. PMI808]|nr:hepatocellular carcinoma-associated antigen 66 [Phaeosphaeriaceae sp. PMI808]
MAGPSDKARFYLEQSATELNELQRKNIFTREEISSIAKKRSDFEHIVNARGSHPSDYLRYIEFEKNVDALRRKRIKRLGARYKGTGQRTIYLLYNRATRKFSGELTLWMQYIDFARRDKAYKRLNDIFTSVARLHPTKPEIWVHAANYFMDTQADMTNARSYMQRGLRFCKKSLYLWLEYAKLETIYIGKIAGRRKALGLDANPHQPVVAGDDENMIALPQVTAEDMDSTLRQDHGVDELALHNLAAAPLLTGAIPLAIFDSAMNQFEGKASIADYFFTMFAEFEQLSCTPHILQHVLSYLQLHFPDAVETAICSFRILLFDSNPTNVDFPLALTSALDVMSMTIKQHPAEAARLSEVAVSHLLPLQRLATDVDADAIVQTILSKTLQKYLRVLGAGSSDKIIDLTRTLQQQGKRSESQALLQLGVKHFGANPKLQQLYVALDT